MTSNAAPPARGTRAHELWDSDCRELHACLSLLVHWGFQEEEIQVEAAKHPQSGNPFVMVSLNTQGKQFVVSLPTTLDSDTFLQTFACWIDDFAKKAPEEAARLLKGTYVLQKEREFGAALLLRGIGIPTFGPGARSVASALRSLIENHPRLQ